MIFGLRFFSVRHLIFHSEWQSELKAEGERSAREKKELCEQMLELESQLEWVRAEKDEEIEKLSADRKALQDRCHDAETQLSQLKSRKRDELKVAQSYCSKKNRTSTFIMPPFFKFRTSVHNNLLAVQISM